MLKKILTAAAITAICSGCAGQPSTGTEPPAPETSVHIEEQSTPTPDAGIQTPGAFEAGDANAELEGKLTVGMTVSSSTEAEITIRNETNDVLEHAEAYIYIQNIESGESVYGDYAMIDDLKPWEATHWTATINPPGDEDNLELIYHWGTNYSFSDSTADDQPEADAPEIAADFMSAVQAADYIAWKSALLDVQCKTTESGELHLILTFGPEVDTVAADMPMGYESIATGAGTGGIGGVFATRVTMQYEDGSIIIDKVM